MSFTLRIAAVALAVLPWFAPDALASRKTVCTITVNSPDEKELFRRTLPPADYDFVELVERGRPDWLASACRKGVRCDVLLISGHFDGGEQFYTDRLANDEYLRVDEMERVACSDTCPGLFSQLKEVYLFGCNTLNAEPLRSATAEVERSLVRAGYSKPDAAQATRALNERYAESNRDRMRNIFRDVPVIYGFSSKAPLGPSAAGVLQRYFQQGGAAEVGGGKPSAKLLALFAPVSMTVVSGASDADPHAGFRRDVCNFADERQGAAQKLRFVHEVLRRNMAEVRMFLDHLERYLKSLGPAERLLPGVAEAFAEIAADHATRARYLEFSRDADEGAVSARMLDAARRLGWLSTDEHRAELAQMLAGRLARDAVGTADVDLACTLNEDRELADELHRIRLPAAQAERTAHAAVLACLGSGDGHLRMLTALTSADDRDVEIAEVYLRHRPLADEGELRQLTRGVARMNGADAQVRALDTLARLRLSDRNSVDELARLFPRTTSLAVQRAIAGVLIRSDFAALAPELAGVLRKHRVKSADGEDAIDILIRRLLARSL